MSRFKVNNFAGQIMLNVDDTSVIIVIGYIYIYMQSKPFLVLNRNFLQVKRSYPWRQHPHPKYCVRSYILYTNLNELSIDTIARKLYANNVAYFRTCAFLILIIISNFPRYLIHHYTFLTASH